MSEKNKNLLVLSHFLRYKGSNVTSAKIFRSFLIILFY
jgi:hypothetical protein